MIQLSKPTLRRWTSMCRPDALRGRRVNFWVTEDLTVAGFYIGFVHSVVCHVVVRSPTRWFEAACGLGEYSGWVRFKPHRVFWVLSYGPGKALRSSPSGACEDRVHKMLSSPSMGFSAPPLHESLLSCLRVFPARTHDIN